MGRPAQSLTLVPGNPLLGKEVRIRFRPPGEGPVEGLEVRIRLPDGKTVSIGRTDPGGELAWTPAKTWKGDLLIVREGIPHFRPIEVGEPHGLLTFTLPLLLFAALLWLLLGRWVRKPGRSP